MDTSPETLLMLAFILFGFLVVGYFFYTCIQTAQSRLDCEKHSNVIFNENGGGVFDACTISATWLFGTSRRVRMTYPFVRTSFYDEFMVIGHAFGRIKINYADITTVETAGFLTAGIGLTYIGQHFDSFEDENQKAGCVTLFIAGYNPFKRDRILTFIASKQRETEVTQQA